MWKRCSQPATTPPIAKPLRSSDRTMQKWSASRCAPKRRSSTRSRKARSCIRERAALFLQPILIHRSEDEDQKTADHAAQRIGVGGFVDHDEAEERDGGEKAECERQEKARQRKGPERDEIGRCHNRDAKRQARPVVRRQQKELRPRPAEDDDQADDREEAQRNRLRPYWKRRRFDLHLHISPRCECGA